MQRKTQDGQPSRMTITTVAKTLLFDCSVLQQRGHCAPENNTLKYFYYVKIHFNDKVTIHRYIEEVSDFFFFFAGDVTGLFGEYGSGCCVLSMHMLNVKSMNSLIENKCLLT